MSIIRGKIINFHLFFDFSILPLTYVVQVYLMKRNHWRLVKEVIAVEVWTLRILLMYCFKNALFQKVWNTNDTMGACTWSIDL